MACIQAVGGGSVGSFCTRLKRGKDTLKSRSQIGAFRNCHMGSRRRISVIPNASGEKGSKMEAGSMHRVPKGIRTTKGSVGSSMKATDPALGTVQTGEEKEVRPLQQIKLPKVSWLSVWNHGRWASVAIGLFISFLPSNVLQRILPVTLGRGSDRRWCRSYRQCSLALPPDEPLAVQSMEDS
jgi:hypothetical protein